MIDHETPRDDAVYRHTPTDQLVRYLGRRDGDYAFSVNGGERVLELRTEDWPAYRELLTVDGWA